MSESKFRPIPELTPDQIERFWSYVPRLPNDVCWPWEGFRLREYGVIRFRRIYFRAHRVMYYLHYKSNVGGIGVLHHCDNPPCVNPHHLFKGTYADNNQDRARKGRSSKTKKWYKFGSQIPSSKLKEQQVIEIIEKHKQGQKIRPLSREYGVTHRVVSLIVRRKSWLHIKSNAIEDS